MYAYLKLLHVTLAIVSVSGFMRRAWWSVNESPLLKTRFARIAPHVVDTFFLLAGIAMIWIASLPVLSTPWLLAKFAGLVVYVLVGTVAIKRGKTREIRLMASILAVGVFAWVVGISIRKSPLSWLTPMVG